MLSHLPATPSIPRQWDMAGQHPSNNFLRNADGVVFVCDAGDRASVDRITSSYLALATRRDGAALPSVVVANKADTVTELVSVKSAVKDAFFRVGQVAPPCFATSLLATSRGGTPLTDLAAVFQTLASAMVADTVSRAGDLAGAGLSSPSSSSSSRFALFFFFFFFFFFFWVR